MQNLHFSGKYDNMYSVIMRFVLERFHFVCGGML